MSGARVEELRVLRAGDGLAQALGGQLGLGAVLLGRLSPGEGERRRPRPGVRHPRSARPACRARHHLPVRGRTRGGVVWGRRVARPHGAGPACGAPARRSGPSRDRAGRTRRQSVDGARTDTHPIGVMWATRGARGNASPRDAGPADRVGGHAGRRARRARTRICGCAGAGISTVHGCCGTWSWHPPFGASPRYQSTPRCRGAVGTKVPIRRPRACSECVGRLPR